MNNVKMVKMTTEEFVKRVNEKTNGEYIPLEGYTNSGTKVLIKHSSCGHEWRVKPNDFLNKDAKCPKCNSNEFRSLGKYVKYSKVIEKI